MQGRSAVLTQGRSAGDQPAPPPPPPPPCDPPVPDEELLPDDPAPAPLDCVGVELCVGAEL
jgi:hypothetical protein